MLLGIVWLQAEVSNCWNLDCVELKGQTVVYQRRNTLISVRFIIKFILVIKCRTVIFYYDTLLYELYNKYEDFVWSK